jgi:Tfp pilus assembly PilM family ATPase
MPQKILGLDIGDSAVKAVLVARNLTGHSKIIAADIVSIEEAGDLNTALDHLFEKSIYRDTSCVLSLPAKALSYRNVRLPFRDKKRIEQTIAYELEPLIQLPIDNIYFDYIKHIDQGESVITAVTVDKSFLDERLKLLAGYIKNITMIDADAVACALRLLAKEVYQETFILLDVGMKNTVAVFVDKGKIVQMRYFSFGGSQLTDKGAHFSAELKNTVEYLIWQGIMAKYPSRIVLTGGGALLEGIEEGLSESLSIPVEKFDVLETDSIRIDEAVRERWPSMVMNQAAALATRSVDENVGFNFKRRILAAKRSFDEVKKEIRWVSVAVLIIVCLGITDGYLDYRVSKSKLDQIKRDVIAEFKKHSPETKNIREPVAQKALSMLKTSIEEAKKVTAGITLSQSDAIAIILDILKEVSSITPASAELLISTFSFENGVISIKGEAKNFDAVDVVKNELIKSKYFKSVQIGAANLMKQGERVEFELRIEIRS